MNGKIYFVSAPGRIKIGYTRKPEIRLAQLRSVDMEELTTLAIEGGTRCIERKLHDLVKPYCIRGEWFADCPQVRSVMDDFVSGRLKLSKSSETAPSDDPDETPTPLPFANPSVVGLCKKLSEHLASSISRGDDKHVVRARADALITVTEELLGQSLHRASV